MLILLTNVQFFNKAVQYKKTNSSNYIDFLNNNIKKIKINNFNRRFIAKNIAKIFGKSFAEVYLWLIFHK